MALTVLARCKKCGREFVLLPAAGMTDGYPPPDMNPRTDYPTDRVCGGELELTAAGRVAVEKPIT